MAADRGLAEVSHAECMRLLGRATFGRVGLCVDGVPAIFPVIVALVDDVVVFRTVPGTKLEMASGGAVVALEVDEFDRERREGWSVLVRGLASVVDDDDLAARARAVLVPTWIGEDAAEHLVQISTDLVTGRRLA